MTKKRFKTYSETSMQNFVAFFVYWEYFLYRYWSKTGGYVVSSGSWNNDGYLEVKEPIKLLEKY